MAEYIVPPDEFIAINQEKCTGCGRCIEVCANRTFKLVNDKALVIKSEGCYECFACSLVCPLEAIQFKIPKGGTGIIYHYG